MNNKEYLDQLQEGITNTTNFVQYVFPMNHNLDMLVGQLNEMGKLVKHLIKYVEDGTL